MMEATAMDRIVLTGMRFESRLGVTDEERALPQLVEVDIELEAALDAAATSDDIADAIDYVPVVERTRDVVERGEYRLLEALAAALADAALETGLGATAVTVRLRKLAVQMDVEMDHAMVELRRERLREAGSGT